MIIIAIKVNVAFQTIQVTLKTSWKFTTPTISASTAPPHADHPIDKFLGCHMTRMSVIKKINVAMKIDANAGTSNNIQKEQAFFI